MQHPGDAYVLDEAGLAGHLTRQVFARRRRADNPVALRRLQRSAARYLQLEQFASHQFGVGHRTFGILLDRDDSLTHAQLIRLYIQAFGRHREHGLPRLGRSLAQRRTATADRHASGGVALIGRQFGIPHDHPHPLERQVQFLGHDLRQGGAHAGSQFDFSAEGGHRIVGLDRQPVIQVVADLAPDRFAPA